MTTVWLKVILSIGTDRQPLHKTIGDRTSKSTATDLAECQGPSSGLISLAACSSRVFLGETRLRFALLG